MPSELHVAVLGMGLSSEITAGENRGRHSRHEFVVLAHRSAHGTTGHWSLDVPLAAAEIASRRALVL